MQAVVMVKPRETWTHNFCLLSSTVQDTSPLLEELLQLKDAGLGKKNVVFSKKDGNFEHFKNTLEKEYEKLKAQEGAFELLRAETGGIGRPLKIIPMPAEGYSVPFLKDFVGSMKASLSLEKVEPQVNISSPVTKCPKCCLPIPIVKLRDHTSKCGKMVEIKDDTESADDDDDDDFDKSPFDPIAGASTGMIIIII